MTSADSPAPIEGGNVAPAPAPTARDLRQLIRIGRSAVLMRFIESREYVEDPGALTRIPRAPVWLKGLVSVSSQAVPVIDLAIWTREDWRAADAARGRLHILRMGDGPSTWAMAIAESPSVVDLSLWTSQPVTLQSPLAITVRHGKLTQFATTLWAQDDRSALEMDWPRLVNALKQDLTTAYTSQA